MSQPNCARSLAVVLCLSLGAAIGGCSKKDAASGDAPAGQTKQAATQKAPPPAPDPLPDDIAVRQILVSYTGAEGARGGIKRTRDEAKARAEQVMIRLKGGAGFPGLASKFSDDAAARGGGYLGALSKKRLRANLAGYVVQLKDLEHTEIIESPMGFHILRREPMRKYKASHILIAWQGAARALPRVTRTEGEADHFSRELAKKLKEEGGEFAAMAKEHSDDPTADRGGSLGEILQGHMPPAFDRILFNLKPGEWGGPTKTQFGYHLIRRDE